MQLYEHSGAVTISGLILASLVGVVTGCVLGGVYTFTLILIPFIYINFLLTAGFGAVIGVVVGWAAKVGKIRNNLVVGFLGFVFGLVGLYFAWAVAPLVRLEGGFVAWNPEIILKYLELLYENGSWTLFGDNPVKGIFLLLVWILEGGIILTLAVSLALSPVMTRPFCERCHEWTTIEEDVQRLSLEDAQETLLQRILEGEIDALGEFFRAEEDEAVYLRLDLAHCLICLDSNFLTIQTITQTTDKNGDLSTEEESLVGNLVIGEVDMESVRNAGRDRPPDEDEAEAEEADQPS